MRSIMKSARYKDHFIEVTESSPGRWRTTIRRQDGSDIETGAGKFESITTGSVESLSSADAIVVGRAVIDRIRRQKPTSPGT